MTLHYLLLQLVPVPVKPTLHVQVKLPIVSEHVAFRSQLCLFVEHSLMSEDDET